MYYATLALRKAGCPKEKTSTNGDFKNFKHIFCFGIPVRTFHLLPLVVREGDWAKSRARP
jgi:hypothetical protein